MSIIVLHPCATFDAFATELTETEASELLSAWTAAFHPAVLQAAVQFAGTTDCEIPRWESASYSAYNLQNDIVIVPPCCGHFWTDEWSKQTASCLVIKDEKNCENIVTKIVSSTENSTTDTPGAELTDDFYAVAVAKLLTDLTARNLHYIDSNTGDSLKVALFDAVRSYHDGNTEAVKRHLQEAFEQLSQMRDNYYPITNYFVELTLVTETTAGEALRQRLTNTNNVLVNLFIPTALIAKLPETQPETFAVLKDAVANGCVKFIIDEADGDAVANTLHDLPLLDIADRLLESVSLYRDLFNITPVIYGRQTIGLIPVLPQLLKLCGFKGVLHFAPLDGWHLDNDDQSKMIWHGIGETKIDALIRYPVDASSAKGFFQFADTLGMTLNHDHAPTAVFAMFPGQTSPYLDYLRLMTGYITTLGKFLDIEAYFEDTPQTGGVQQHGYEKYPFPDNTATRSTAYHEAVERLASSATETMSAFLGQRTEMQQEPETVYNDFSFSRTVFDADDNAVELPPCGVVKRAASSELRTANDTSEHSQRATRNSLLQFIRFTPKTIPLLINRNDDDLGKGVKRSVYLLENRYFQAKFDAATGMLRSIFTSKSRFNQLSRQLAFYNGSEYSIQTADNITIIKNAPLAGILEIAGRLVMPDGTVAGRYTETICIRSESRILDFSLQITPAENTAAANSFFTVRYAWNDNTLDLYGGIHDAALPVAGKRIRAPLFIDLRNVDQSLTFFSLGLPLHRRVGERHLDTVLPYSPETYKLAIGVNVKHPYQIALSRLRGDDTFPFPKAEIAQSYWLFQIESHSVSALHWEPLTDENGRAAGFMVYLRETEGRRAHFAFRMFRNPTAAAALNLLGEEVKTFKIDGDAVLIDMHGYELLPLRVMC